MTFRTFAHACAFAEKQRDDRHISLDGHRVEEYRNSGLIVLSYPEAHHRLLRTTNGVERVNREIKRRTQVASIFPNEASCLRLVSALLMENSDDWQAGKAYLTLSQ